eukprot:2074147-Pyramimonas_sp.AAC.1
MDGRRSSSAPRTGKFSRTSSRTRPSPTWSGGCTPSPSATTRPGSAAPASRFWSARRPPPSRSCWRCATATTG